MRDNPLAHRIYLDLEKESDRLLTAPLAEYKLTGPRLQRTDRSVLDRVSTLALMYRLSRRDPYLRARRRSNFTRRPISATGIPRVSPIPPRWRTPSRSATTGFTIRSRPTNASWMRDAMVSKALDPAIAALSPRQRLAARHSTPIWSATPAWGLAALAIAGDAVNAAETVNDKCATVLRLVSRIDPAWPRHLWREGSWPEGLAYWESRHALCLRFFQRAADVAEQRFRPELLSWRGPRRTLSHSHDRPHRQGLQLRRFRRGRRPCAGNVLDGETFQHASLCVERAESARAQHSSRCLRSRMVRSRRQIAPAATPAWPPDAIFRGVDVACFRSCLGRPERALPGRQGRRQ